MSIYVPITLVAKTVKSRLNKYFPDVKWSVRSEKYSMGSTLHVSWNDGPTKEQVKEIVDIYHGSHYEQNGGDSIKAYHDITCPETGKQIKCGNDHLSYHRGFSFKACEQLVKEFIIKYPSVLDSDFEIKENWDHKFWYVLGNRNKEIPGAARTYFNDVAAVFGEFSREYSFTEAQNPSSEYSETPQQHADSDVQSPTISEYKGNQIINLPMDNGKDFSFGVTKAKTILQYLEEIKKFVGDNS